MAQQRNENGGGVLRRREPGFYITRNDIFLVDGLNPNAFTVYSYLLRLATQYDAVFPSHETIAKACWMSVGTVKRSLKLLEKLGLLEVERVPGRANNYYVCDPDLSKPNTRSDRSL